MLDESKRTRQKKAEIKGRGGEEKRKTRRKSKTREGKNRAASQMAKEIQGMMKTGQRKRRKMTVIKIQKQGSEQKSRRKGTKQGGRRPKNQGKKGKKWTQTRAQQGCPK